MLHVHGCDGEQEAEWCKEAAHGKKLKHRAQVTLTALTTTAVLGGATKLLWPQADAHQRGRTAQHRRQLSGLSVVLWLDDKSPQGNST